MIFVTIASQRDNLGDSLLRRPLVRAGQSSGPCHVFVGRGAEDWTNLGLRPQDRVYTSRSRWAAELMRSALVRRTALLLNAGELLPGRRFTLNRMLLAPAIGLIRFRGGALIHTGFGLRNPEAPVPIIARLGVRASTVVSWRDEASRAAVDVGTVAPDWAMGEGVPPETLDARRDARATDRVLAMSLRGDRPAPTAAWIAETKRIVRTELNARLVVVCQVRRDRERSKWLAEELGAELVDWATTTDHADQERLVREAYAKATWVTSDRLHSVVMAVTEGAVPLAIVPDGSRKVTRALAVIDLALLPSRGAAGRLAEDQAEVRRALVFARGRLHDLETAIARSIAGTRTRPIRVLHTISAPNRETRYARHMAATEDFGIRPIFFGVRRALFGRFDVLHVHWPEHFVPAGKSVRSRVARLLAHVVLWRARNRAAPVLRTLHNLVPHSIGNDASGNELRAEVDRMTRAEVHLVPGDPSVSGSPTHLVPHGSYREPYAGYAESPAVPARVLHFGRLEEYKGVPELLDAFSASRRTTLRIVGSPSNPSVVAAIEEFAVDDERLVARLGFVPDSELAEEIFRSSYCVFPYRELHSSGAVLVALSLNRPVLVPRTPTTEALRAEVGEAWVRIYESLDGAELDSAAAWASIAIESGLRPRLSDRSWGLVRARLGVVTRSVLRTTA